MSHHTSAAVAWPVLAMKFECRSVIWASPRRAPRRPTLSTSSHALPASPPGFFQVDPHDGSS